MHARASSLRASSTPNAAGRMTTARKGSSGRRAATPTRRGGRAVVARAASSQQNVMPANAEDKPIAIVTGSSSGLGLYTAKALIKNGYFVVNAVRSPEKMQVKANELGLDESSYAIMYLELGDLQSVRDFATEAMMGMIRQDLALLGVRMDIYSSEKALYGSGRIEAQSSRKERKAVQY